MVAITVRDVPDDVRSELASRAAQAGQSLQEYLRAELIQMAGRPSLDVVVARARERARALRSTVSADAIVDHLAADRR
jgi:antitoxin FitA